MNKIFMYIFEKAICITAKEDIYLNDIIDTFSLFINQEIKQDDIDVNIIIENGENNEYRIIYNGQLSSCAKVNIYPKLCDIIRRSLIQQTDLFCFHAAAVEKNGRSYVFVSTGNSGKSTLCTSLLFQGYKLLSDDTCWISPASGIMYPYPMAIGISHKTLVLLPTLNCLVKKTSFPGKLILPVQKPWVSVPSNNIVFLVWDLKLDIDYFQLLQINKMEFALNLIANSFSFKYCSQKEETFYQLQSILENSNCFHLKGSNLSVLPQLLESI